MYIKANNPFLLSSVLMQSWRIDLFRSNYSASGDCRHGGLSGLRSQYRVVTPTVDSENRYSKILTNRIVLLQSIIMFKLSSVIVLLSLLTAVAGWTWKKPSHKFDKVKISAV